VRGLHHALAIVAALSAAAAGIVDRAGTDLHALRRADLQARRQPDDFIQSARFISAPELAERIMRSDPDLRVFDLRPRASFDQFHIPGANHATADGLASVPLSARASLVLYGDRRAAVVDALRALRARDHRDVRVLREGMFEWLGRVQEPRLAADATRAEREEFDRAAAMSRFFGGVPIAGVSRADVPQGYWTGVVRTEELLMAAALNSVGAIRRRGC
jgi:rhodanese-related sulfurtransferase